MRYCLGDRFPITAEARVLEHRAPQLSLERGSCSGRFIGVDRRMRDAGVARCRATAN